MTSDPPPSKRAEARKSADPNKLDKLDTVYIPDQPAVQAHITSRLLDANAADICDVTLRTSDRRDVPACRTLLAIRSPYFRTLFFGPFREASSDAVSVALPEHILRHVLQFAYSGSCDFVATLCSERDHQKETLLDDAATLVQLIAAADYCTLPQLHRWCNDTLRKLAKRFRFVVCAAFDAITAHPAFHAFPARAALLEILRRNSRECLLVPDSVVTENDTHYQRLYKRRWDSHGVLRLSATSLRAIIVAMPAPPLQEYLFQALYYWATHGQMLPRTGEPLSAIISRSVSGSMASSSSSSEHETQSATSKTEKNPCAEDAIESITRQLRNSGRHDSRSGTLDLDCGDAITNPAVDSERWKCAREMAGELRFHAMRPVFIRDYVRHSGLVDDDALVEAFCYHATKSIPPLQPLDDMPDS